jgi:hypothetical protein
VSTRFQHLKSSRISGTCIDVSPRCTHLRCTVRSDQPTPQRTCLHSSGPVHHLRPSKPGPVTAPNLKRTAAQSGGGLPMIPASTEVTQRGHRRPWRCFRALHLQRLRAVAQSVQPGAAGPGSHRSNGPDPDLGRNLHSRPSQTYQQIKTACHRAHI